MLTDSQHRALVDRILDYEQTLVYMGLPRILAEAINRYRITFTIFTDTQSLEVNWVIGNGKYDAPSKRLDIAYKDALPDLNDQTVWDFLFEVAEMALKHPDCGGMDVQALQRAVNVLQCGLYALYQSKKSSRGGLVIV